MATAIDLRNLAKRFREVQAVAGIDFEVRRGELFGFLGPNGARKNTTINMLTGLTRPDPGSIRSGGIDCTHNPKAAQHLVGVVPIEKLPLLLRPHSYALPRTNGADLLHAGFPGSRAGCRSGSTLRS